MINDSEIENSVNLKPNNKKTNRPNSRKRSAFKFIEDNLEKEKPENNNNFNSHHQNLNLMNKNINNINNNKPKIIGTSENNNINKFLQNVNNDNNINSEKKIEYESRRKKPMNFINGIENFSGIDKNNNNTGSGKNLIKQEMNISGYESRRQIKQYKDKDDSNSGSNKNLSKI